MMVGYNNPDRMVIDPSDAPFDEIWSCPVAVMRFKLVTGSEPHLQQHCSRVCHGGDGVVARAKDVKGSNWPSGH